MRPSDPGILGRLRTRCRYWRFPPASKQCRCIWLCAVHVLRHACVRCNMEQSGAHRSSIGQTVFCPIRPTLAVISTFHPPHCGQGWVPTPVPGTAGCRCAPPAPGFWGVGGPPADTGDSQPHQNSAVAFGFVQCTCCGMFLLGRTKTSTHVHTSFFKRKDFAAIAAHIPAFPMKS